MANYHLYFFDGEDITGLLAFEAASDVEAQRRVAEEADGRAMELWRDGHRLTQLAGEHPSVFEGQRQAFVA